LSEIPVRSNIAELQDSKVGVEIFYMRLRKWETEEEEEVELEEEVNE